MNDDEKWMQVALKEGCKAVGLCSPNPPVGAVLVKDGVELSRGHTQEVGGNHAEREVLSRVAEGEARGATIYVTLEPCSTQGRTGACVNYLMEAGVSRVVYGVKDPNPDHAGRADGILGKVGVEVCSGVCEEECAQLVRAFTMVQNEGRPWVIAKSAMSLDGRITRRPGEGQWLTGAEAREGVQELRGKVDAILTSGETLRQDDPALTVRSEAVCESKKGVLRVVVTREGVNEGDYQLFKDEFREKTVVFEKVELYDVLRTLARDHGVNTVLLEAGGSLLGEFSDQALIDEWIIYLAPLVCGGPKVGLAGDGAGSLEERISLEKVMVKQVGGDLCARGVVSREGRRALERS